MQQDVVLVIVMWCLLSCCSHCTCFAAAESNLCQCCRWILSHTPCRCTILRERSMRCALLSSRCGCKLVPLAQHQRPSAINYARPPCFAPIISTSPSYLAYSEFKAWHITVLRNTFGDLEWCLGRLLQGDLLMQKHRGEMARVCLSFASSSVFTWSCHFALH